MVAGTGIDCRGRVPVSMVERITLIMDAFESRHTLLTLEQATARTGLPRSTAHRILDQLVNLSWLCHTPAGYCLGPRALAFGGQDGTHGEIRAVAASALQELQLHTGLIAHLAVLDGPDVLYLDKVGGPFAAMLPSRVGGRVPAHTTAVGKAMLAWTTPEEVDELLGSTLPRRTERSIGDIDVLHQELARIRTRSGVAFDNQEAVRGVVCVAAAIRDQGHVVAGVSLCGPSGATALERVAPMVLEAARGISRHLFPGSARPRRVPAAATGRPSAPAASAWAGVPARVLQSAAR